MVMIDTSSWIEAMRPKGSAAVKRRVAKILDQGEAAWCDIIRAELWNGSGFGREQRMIRDFEKEVMGFPIDAQVWESTIELATRSRDSGITVPVTDLIVYACANRYGVPLEHNDTHFDHLLTVM